MYTHLLTHHGKITMAKKNIYPIEILLIESSPKKIGLVREMLDNTKIQYKLHIVNNTNETYAFLQKEGIYSDVPKPDAILHNAEPTNEFEKKIADFLDTQVLFLNVTNDKIEITKSNKHAMDHKIEKHGISHILEAIVSVKKFMGSLIDPAKQEI